MSTSQTVDMHAEATLPDDAEILIDTTATPHSYSMHGSSRGQELLVAQNCDDYSFATRAEGSWLPPLASSDGFSVSLDGGVITGQTSFGFQDWSWTITRQ